MFGVTALKSGLAEAASAQSIQDLVGGDQRFLDIWNVTASIPGSFSKLNAAAMFSVLSQAPPHRIVEIGSYLGKSTVFFGKTQQAVGGGDVTAIDPHTGDLQQMASLGVDMLPSLQVFRAHIQACGLTDVVHPIVARSHDAVSDWDVPVDFLYVDGWHSYDAVLQDGKDWLPHLAEHGVVFFDDYSRYKVVHDAVDTLASRGLVRLWGNSFGQALGGRGAPPASIHRLLEVANGRLAQWLHRSRG